MNHLHPIFSLQKAQDWEKHILGESLDTIESAMLRAGQGIGQRIFEDYLEIKPWSASANILVLMGAGYNGGDALIASETLLSLLQRSANLYIVAVGGIQNIKPLVKKVLDRVLSFSNVQCIELENNDDGLSIQLKLDELLKDVSILDVCLDGIYGLNFRLPMPEEVRALIEHVNKRKDILLRAAVDVPSGLMDEGKADSVFKAHFSYSPASLKKPLMVKENREWVGRVRYIDIGFFDHASVDELLSFQDYCALKTCLRSLINLRSISSTKRTVGHLVMIAGSRNMPGALIMSARAALKSGIGLLTICTVKSLVPYLSAAVPEAIWLDCEETEEGYLTMDSLVKILKKVAEAHTVLIGPGMGRDPQTQQLIRAILPKIQCNCILDADGLFAENLMAWNKGENNNRSLTITPHEGEFKRLMGIEGQEEVLDQQIDAFVQHYPNINLVLKGPITSVVSQGRRIYSEFGGPILARGGSGDILAGTIAGLLAQEKSVDIKSSVNTILQAIVWSGIAAELLARDQGQRPICTTQIIEYFPQALRNSSF